ncbi:HDR101Cp [Eremothecium sinecaudum]|uniref:Peroxisome assembly protein 12 n=1 Tax=Eremothecium sinecaudum TaxID=45286 RepID=A0A0X8HSZ2_9SACH|nr:HDR101Cp [Eremothecium sinecaudum]AMD20843.1 HDR101Cp [Eremothecium sinecaudum]
MSFYSNLPVDATATPTLFEVISSQEIDGLLKPTFQYLSATVVGRYPSRTSIAFHSRFDELYACCKLLLEYYHLRKYSATFIEKSYGLQRESKRLAGSLSKLQVGAVLFDNVIVSYIRDKLEYWYTQLEGRRLAGRLTVWQRRFLDWYPSVRKLLAAFSLLCKLRYLSGRTRAASLLDHLASVEFRRFVYEAPAAKSGSIGNSADRIVRMNSAYYKAISGHFLGKMGKFIETLASGLFPTFIFAIRLLQQWNQQPDRKKDDLTEIPPPPPVTTETRDESDQGRICPVCESTVINPGVLQTGYVACYPCAVQYVSEHGVCPVLKTPVLGGTKGIRKLLC